jgi:hypothetical protein
VSPAESTVGPDGPEIGGNRKDCEPDHTFGGSSPLACRDNKQEKPLSVDIDPTASDGGIPGGLNPPAAGSPPRLLPKTAEG